MTNIPPAGWVYVTWHPKSLGFTKIGYSKWHPTEPDQVYTFKRVHQVSRYLVSFGFGPLKSWTSEFHPLARKIETIARRELNHLQRREVRPSTDIFNVDPVEAIELVSSWCGANHAQILAKSS